MTYAQDSKPITPPQIITKIKAGQKVSIGSHELKFISPTQDSRCPSDVSCIWEGEVKGFIELYKNEKLLKQKAIVIKGKGRMSKLKDTLFNIEAQSIFAYNISPYPMSSSKINKEDYILELVIQ